MRSWLILCVLVNNGINSGHARIDYGQHGSQQVSKISYSGYGTEVFSPEQDGPVDTATRVEYPCRTPNGEPSRCSRYVHGFRPVGSDTSPFSNFGAPALNELYGAPIVNPLEVVYQPIINSVSEIGKPTITNSIPIWEYHDKLVKRKVFVPQQGYQ